MNKERLFKILGLLDEDLIEEAENMKKASNRKWGVIAASVLLICGGVFSYDYLMGNLFVEKDNGESSIISEAGEGESAGAGTPENTGGLSGGDKENLAAADEDLPQFNMGFTSGSMGFEGYMAYSIDDLVIDSPYIGNYEQDTLPVFKGNEEKEWDRILTEDEIGSMTEEVVQVANILGLDVDASQVHDNYPDAQTIEKIKEKFAATGEEVPEGYFDADEVYVEQNGINITKFKNESIRITFDTPVKMPEGYDFSTYATYDDKYKAAQYLKTAYEGLLKEYMENPEISIRGGDYNIYAEQRFDVYFYDKGQDSKEDVLNYYYNTMTFYGDEKGDLYIIWIDKADLSEKLGDYPIINEAEAQEMLLAGKFITTVYDDMPKEVYIRAVHIVYRNSRYDETYLPYYKFYVELPNMEREENGLKTYGAYYVPAVEERYIKDLNVWEGQFN